MSETFSDHFFEPNKPPEAVLKNKQDQSRLVRIRFKTKADADAFYEKTGIRVQPGDFNRLNYPLCSALDEFF